ncbi:hypothetical protein BJ170DRAFT_604514 [Xylariales sp. AK1849]|nr:hypothetical protein BJ170DRAFT_604514 [Xylariales sp. AK1849]
MKYSASILGLLSATGTLAVPTKRESSGTRVAKPEYLGFVVPTIIKNHDIASNENTQEFQTATVRNGGIETSTLYEIPIPADLAGKTCGLVIFARKIGNGDNVLGEQAMDIFNNNIPDLLALQEGNFRNQELARVRFDAASGLYLFDETAVTPKIQEFPCPAGKTLEWESVAVGEFDINVIRQDFAFDGENVPNGLSIAYW